MGNTFVDRLTANQAFINTLSTNILNAGSITANTLNITTTVGNIEYHIIANAANGLNFYNIDLNNDDRVDTYKIFPDGSGFMSEGYIRWNSTGFVLYGNSEGESSSNERIGMFTSGNFESQVKESGNWITVNTINKNGSGSLAKGNIHWDINGNTTF